MRIQVEMTSLYCLNRCTIVPLKFLLTKEQHLQQHCFYFNPEFFHAHCGFLKTLFFIVVQVQLSTIPPHPTHPHPSPPPTFDPTPLWLCPCVLYTCFLTNPSPFFPVIPLPPLLWLLSICSFFKVCGSILLAYLFVD